MLSLNVTLLVPSSYAGEFCSIDHSSNVRDIEV